MDGRKFGSTPTYCASYFEFCGVLGEYGISQNPGLGNVLGG